jgi:hypothetical protein
VVRARVDRKATAISPLAAIGGRRDGQTVLSGLGSMSGESAAAWTAFLEDMTRRGLKAPELLIVDGAPGLDAALVALWPEVPVQRGTVHEHRNLLAHAPKRLQDELTGAWRDMIYAETAAKVEAKREAFLRRWRLKCRAVADSLEEAGERLFTFTRLPPGSGSRPGARTRSSGCTRSSSAASSPGPCCPRPRPCSSGRCSPPAGSRCARSTAGSPSPRPSPIRRSTSPLETVTPTAPEIAPDRCPPPSGQHLRSPVEFRSALDPSQAVW